MGINKGEEELVTLPGFVDLHVHFREPGDNPAETIESGSLAAMMGGYALVADMPNNPGNPTWTMNALREKIEIAKGSSWIPITFYAGHQPETDTSLYELQKMSERSIGLKLYGAPTTGNDNDYDASDFEETVNAWHEAAPDKPIMFHAGRDNLRDMIDMVAKRVGHHLHVCHVSDPSEAGVIHRIQQNGYPVSSGVTPHHIFKSSHDERSEGWFARMVPPLVEGDKAEALFNQLSNGVIDVLETDHAPHTKSAKFSAEIENPFGIHDPDHRTCFGVPGIEFAAPLMFNQERLGMISMERIVEVMSTNPAEILGVEVDRNSKVVWDLGGLDRVEQSAGLRFGSKSEWTPYLGKLIRGRVVEMKVEGSNLVSDSTPVSKKEDYVIINRTRR